MPGCCAVLGCRSRFLRGGKHFYRFPKNEHFKNLWKQFTRRADYEVKSCSAVCEDHFHPSRIISKKKGRLYLMKETVPTIYYRETKVGTQKITIDFDYVNLHYVGEETVVIPRNDSEMDDERNLIEERKRRIKDLKNLCRFCFECQDEKFVPISKLQAYSIDAQEVFSVIGIQTHFNDVLSEIVCEQCFQHIVSIETYRKRCQKSQELVVDEMQELDEKMLQLGLLKDPWHKFSDEDDLLNSQQFEIIEEHLEENISYVDEADYTGEAYDPNEFESYKIEEDSKDFSQIIIKDDTMKDEEIEDIIEQDEEFDYDQTMDHDDVENDDFNNTQEYQAIENDGVIKNLEKNAFALRVYECFFCRMRFAGKKTFKSHDCPNKEVKCEVEGCDKSFNKLSGYNTHVVKVHGLLKTTKHYCPICKNVIMATEDQFKLHCRQCNKDLEKKEDDYPIECEICKKNCPNLKSYTIHKLFHDTRNYRAADRGENSANSSLKSPVICELCGKEFTNAQGLRTHRKNVHRVGVPEDIIYQCDICSKLRPTKRSLFNHMRNVHRVREAPCTVCNKIFRTPALLQKHMMYHDETKRIHRCPMCPEKPGWFTAVALRRHQKSHHVGLKGHACDIPYCESAFTTNSMLKLHKKNIHGIQQE